MGRPTRVLALALALATASCGKPGPAPPPAADPGSAPMTTDAQPTPAPTSAAAAPAHDPFLAQYAQTYRFRLGMPAGARIAPDGKVLFLRSGPRSFVRDLYELDPATGQERQLLTAAQVLAGASEELSDEEKARRERLRLAARGLVSFDLTRDGETVLVPLSGRLYVVDRATQRSRELRPPDPPAERAAGDSFVLDPQLSRAGDAVAFVRDDDLWVADVATGQERRLTTEGGASATVSWGTAEFVAQEEMDRHHGFWWAPDGARLAVQRTDTAAVETLHIMDPTDPGRPPRAWPYPRPGKANADVQLFVLGVRDGSKVPVAWDRARYPYLATVTWPAKGPLTLVVQDRAQREQQVLAVDPDTGRTATLLTERDDAWINLDQGFPRWLADGERFLWATERGGAWQIELRARDGELLRPLTQPDLGLRGLVDVDEERGALYVLASADPTQTHVVRVGLEDGRVEALTKAPGVHGATFGEDGARWLHTAWTLDGEVTWTLRDPTGRPLASLRSVAEPPPFAANVELTTVAEDEPAGALHAAVVRPRRFQPGQRYPVVVHVYGGPHHQHVTANGRAYLFDQWFADLGYVVVRLDGRGTPGRGRAWERAIRGDFIGKPLADQVRGLKALGARHPELDLTRVGIHGWSFGGYFSAMAVMQRPDVFHAAVAGAPVVDWLDYDTHYTERYLGLPAQAPDAYRVSNVLTYAAELTRPLLLLHGTADDNVYFTHSVKLSDALFRAGIAHDFLPLSGFTHMVPDPNVTTRLYHRFRDHFAKHLKAR